MKGGSLGPVPSRGERAVAARSRKMSQKRSPDITAVARAGQAWLATVSSRGPSPLHCLPRGPTHLLSEGSAKLTCSAAFVLGGLKQGPALSESCLTLAHTQHHCSQKEMHSVCMHTIR